MPTCGKCGRTFPNYTIILGKRRNISNRKYCLLCSNCHKEVHAGMHIERISLMEEQCSDTALEKVQFLHPLY